MAADTRASGVAVPHRALFLLAHPPHCRSQPWRPRGADDRLLAAQPVSRRHHRRPGAEPDHPGQNHLGCDCRLGGGRHRHHHHRSRQAPAARAGPIRCAVSERRGRDPVLHQSGADRPRAASAGHADAHPRAHLRQRRKAVARIRVRCRRTARSSAPICPIPRNAGGLWSG